MYASLKCIWLYSDSEISLTLCPQDISSGLWKSLGRWAFTTWKYIPSLAQRIKYAHLPCSLWAIGSDEAGLRKNINGKRISWRRRSKSFVITQLSMLERIDGCSLRGWAWVIHAAKKPHPVCVVHKAGFLGSPKPLQIQKLSNSTSDSIGCSDTFDRIAS